MFGPTLQKPRLSPQKSIRIVVVLAVFALLTAARPAAAQTPEFIFSVGKFVAEMGIAGPACGIRDRVWATRLTSNSRQR
jgi:hypothetical protein